MDSDSFRKAAHSAIEEIISYYETIQDRPVLANVKPGYLRELLPASPPNEGEPWSVIQQDIESKIVPGLTHWQSPNFMAYFPSTTSYPSMLGELYSAAFTAPAFNWLCSPAVTELETIVLDWFARMLNLPPCFLSESEGGGVIQGSASEAIVTVMVAARDRAINSMCQGLEGDEREETKSRVRGRLVALGTEESHSSTAKAAMIAGVRHKIISVRMEDHLALTGEGLSVALEECRRDNLEPFYLTTTLGTTSTCATDRFEEIKEVVKPYPLLWVHVDAAYAGAALICEEYHHLARSFDGFDSFDVNMHKWLLVNFDASCLFIKNRRSLISALSITPSYLHNPFSSSGLVTDYRDWQIPLGRRFRALKIWFVLRTYGVTGLKAYIRDRIQLSRVFQSLVHSRPDLFRILTPPAFALTVLAIVPPKEIPISGESPPSEPPPPPSSPRGFFPNGTDSPNPHLARANALTKQVYEAINAAGKIFLTSTVIKGIYAIRVVSANPLADEPHLHQAFEILVRTAEEAIRGE